MCFGLAIRAWLRSFRVIQDHQNYWYQSKPVYAFLLIFHCKYIPIFYQFRDVTIYWSKIYGFFCRRHQSFRQVSSVVRYNSTVDCMRNANKSNKCPKIPHSAMVKKMKKWSGIRTRIRITTRSLSLLEGRSLPMSAKFSRHLSPHSSVILFTDDRKNDRTIT